MNRSFAVSLSGAIALFLLASTTDTQPEKEAREKHVVVDIYGKRFRPEERYIAERRLPGGRIIAYRRNEREIAELVKALKKDGYVNETILDRKAWMQMICDRTERSGCNGGCGIGYKCVYGILNDAARQKPRAGKFVGDNPPIRDGWRCFCTPI